MVTQDGEDQLLLEPEVLLLFGAKSTLSSDAVMEKWSGFFNIFPVWKTTRQHNDE